MSEKSKGDVSSSSPARVVKNPLLSASVTGLTFDDFPNKPQLLPAAPPIVQAPSVHSTPALIAGISVNREPKTLVTVGSTSAIDTDNLDEINLNASVEEPTASANAYYSVLEPDGNANLVSGTNSESILSQAASSFTALPAVASNVFSTFSKRIYANAGSRDSTPPRQDTQPTLAPQQFSQFQSQLLQPQLQQQPELQPQLQQQPELQPQFQQQPELQLIQPPNTQFLSGPQPSLPAAIATAPPANASNIYRFASRKKLYAPIPGLTLENQKAKSPDPHGSLRTNLPKSHPLFSFANAATDEERKSALFSLRNLVPSSVLQNISGLVQSAADSLAPTTNPQDDVFANPEAEAVQYPIYPLNAPPYPPSLYDGSIVNTSPEVATTAAAQTSQTLQTAAEPIGTAAEFFASPSAAASATPSPAPVAFYNPTQYQPTIADTGPQAVGTTLLVSNQQQSLPATQLAPPPPPSGSTSFRLQKGTRQYKNPAVQATATTVQTAPLSTLLTQGLDQRPPASPVNLNTFNPFAEAKPLVSEDSSAVVAPTPATIPTSITSNLSANPPFVPLAVDGTHISAPTPSEFLLATPTPPLATAQAQPVAATVVSNAPPTPAAAAAFLGEEAPLATTSPLSVNLLQPAGVSHPSISTDQHIPTESNDVDSLVPHFNDQLVVDQAKQTEFYQAAAAEPALNPTLVTFFTPQAADTSSAFNLFATSAPVADLVCHTTTNYFGHQPSGQTAQAVFPTVYAPVEIAPSVPSATLEVLCATDQPTQAVPAPLGFESFLTQQQSISEIGSSNRSDKRQVDTDAALGLTGTSDSAVNSFSKYFSDPQNCDVGVQQQLSSEKYLEERQEVSALPTTPPPPPPNFDSQAIDISKFFDNLSPIAIRVGEKIGDGVDVVIESAARTATEVVISNEDQRIQNFFNNPPPKENSNGLGDLNYDLVHSGLAVKNLEARSQTSISNLVEPPSSACSEFSELNNSLGTQISQQQQPQRQQPLSEAQIQHIQQQSQAHSQSQPQAQLHTAPETDYPVTADFPDKFYEDLLEDIQHELRMSRHSANEQDTAQTVYTPAVNHWFHKREINSKPVWLAFSHYDSALLETTFTGNDESMFAEAIPVQGGRYDVNIRQRTKTPVYWEGEATEVRRCSWFYKGLDSKYIPYDEATAEMLEGEYKKAAESGVWHQKITLAMGEQVHFHGPSVIVHLHQQQSIDSWGGATQTPTRPRIVKRDLDELVIAQDESQRVDHLLFMVHGIGSVCDLKLRVVEEVVEDFREIAQHLVQSHYKNSSEMGVVGRVEVLPISWHSHLHSVELGIDEKLKSITLESLPKLRSFTNDTLLDVLFYTSPKYCQKVMDTVATSLNEVYLKYRSRNPDFNGGVSLAGHSLGSLIIFDLLCHQEPLKECEEQNMENPDEHLPSSCLRTVQVGGNDCLSRQVSYTMGLEGTGQPYISCTQLIFQPKKFFALGSPIGMFVTIRGIDKLGLDFRLPTCPGFYNIFHPFDPVAYRIEALVNPDMTGIRPVLIPHHKGRKRMHLELKETMTRVGADIKQRFLETFKTTLGSVNFLTSSSSSAKDKKEVEETMEKEVNSVLQMQMQFDQQQQQQQNNENASQASSSHAATRTRTNSVSTTVSDSDMVEIDFSMGKLNDSKRVDYVLQEAPLESINEYIFALSSHVCYWESEDTILFVMKEIYAGLGISPDSQVPQQSMTIERPSSRNSVSQTLLPL